MPTLARRVKDRFHQAHPPGRAADSPGPCPPRRRLLLLLALAPIASCRLAPSVPAEDYIGPAMTAARPAATPSTQPSPDTQPDTVVIDPRVLRAGALRLTVDEAIILALANNRALNVQRINPLVFRTRQDVERAVFDPVLTAGAEYRRERTAGSITESDGVSNRVSPFVAGSIFLPTGTTAALELSTDLTWSKRFSDQYETRAGLTVTQALLRGAGTEVNLVSLRQSRLDTLASQFELRGFAEALVADVEFTYWEYALAQRQIDIFQASMQLAEQQLRETQDRITVGKLAETELAAAQAEVALRREDVINARSQLDKVRLRMLRLLNPTPPGRGGEGDRLPSRSERGGGGEGDKPPSPPGTGGGADGNLDPGGSLWDRQIEILNPPQQVDATLDDVEQHVAIALAMRPDLNQARLAVRRGELEVVRTRNGLLPRLDLFVTLGKTGYAESFGRSLGNLVEEGSYDLLAGAAFSYPPHNRDARARHQAAVLTREQSERAVANLAQLVQVDVRSAYVEVMRAREQVTATTATRRFQEEKARAEVERLRADKSTSLLVAVAQRDLLASQIGEIRAVVNHLQALVELHRLEGSLLTRWHIDAPGSRGATGIDAN